VTFHTTHCCVVQSTADDSNSHSSGCIQCQQWSYSEVHGCGSDKSEWHRWRACRRTVLSRALLRAVWRTARHLPRHGHLVICWLVTLWLCDSQTKARLLKHRINLQVVIFEPATSVHIVMADNANHSAVAPPMYILMSGSGRDTYINGVIKKQNPKAVLDGMFRWWFGSKKYVLKIPLEHVQLTRCWHTKVYCGAEVATNRWFLPCDCMQCNAWYCCRNYVCLSVRVSHAWIMTKLNDAVWIL